MIQGINNIGDIFAHITADVPFSAQKLRRLIDQVRGEYPVDDAFGVSLVETVQTGRKETEGSKDKDLIRFPFLQGGGSLQNAFSGGNHVSYRTYPCQDQVRWRCRWHGSYRPHRD